MFIELINTRDSGWKSLIEKSIRAAISRNPSNVKEAIIFAVDYAGEQMSDNDIIEIFKEMYQVGFISIEEYHKVLDIEETRGHDMAVIYVYEEFIIPYLIEFYNKADGIVEMIYDVAYDMGVEL